MEPAPNFLQPGSLWSLWDMLQLKAGPFVEALVTLNGLASFVGGATSAADWGDVEVEQRVLHGKATLNEDDRRYVKIRVDRLQEHVVELGANVTALCIDEFMPSLTHNFTTWATVRDHLNNINNTLRRELSLRTHFVLSAKEQTLYSGTEPQFGGWVQAQFPSEGDFEIDEASKCLALGRSTASVFHLMRVMEIALKAISKCLGIPDPVKASDRNWGHILKSIKDELDRRASSKAWGKPDDRALFESLYASLDAVRVAWRNTTMHVDKKYTDEEAEQVFFAVKGLMRALAERCDEDGVPSA